MLILFVVRKKKGGSCFRKQIFIAVYFLNYGQNDETITSKLEEDLGANG